jgi:hypothetical protein
MRATAATEPEAPTPRSGLALASMICGLAGLLLCFMVVPSLIAVMLGLVAMRRIRAADGAVGGMAAARVGVVTGVIGVLAGGVFIVAAVVGVFDDDARSVFSLEVGDCVDVDLNPSDGAVSSVPVVDCDEPHVAEVFHVGELNPDRTLPYPAQERDLFRLVVEACVQPTLGRMSPFEEYVGVPFGVDDALDLYPVAPDERAWEPTGGQFVCMVVPADDDDVLVGSVRGSRI